MSLKYARLEDALVDNPGRLIIELDRNIFGGQDFLRLHKPGPTPRSKSVDILGVVVLADEGQTHADLLETLAGALRRSYEIRADVADGQ